MQSSPIKCTFSRFTIAYILVLLLLLASTPVAADDQFSQPRNAPDSIYKAFALGISAVSSFGAGITAYLLESNDNASTQTPAVLLYVNMALKGTSAVCLLMLSAGYSLWFLRSRPNKARDFVIGAAVCVLVLVIMSREGSEANAATWLDKTNIIGFISVMMGILNAESGLLSALFCARKDEEGDDMHDRDSISLDAMEPNINGNFRVPSARALPPATMSGGSLPSTAPARGHILGEAPNAARPNLVLVFFSFIADLLSVAGAVNDSH
ncbi:hypothetical protein VTJ49DRAFT_3453 [Mycothermus thermophilus]|uniref:Uncharacterized protein n=1 Tax=Humicola insolens TaxID=85995 RepID=A0ABR3V847_HUMIN